MFDDIKGKLLALPSIAGWPQVVDIIRHLSPMDGRALWEYPIVACRAVRGSAEAQSAGAAAIFCAVAAIHLVDDMLDDDPDGAYRSVGAGQAANMAGCLQGLAHLIMDAAPAPEAARAAAQRCLAQALVDTAFGQHLDLAPERDEVRYWEIAAAKTPPLFTAALKIGALLGGCSAEVLDGLERLGGPLGLFIQVSDDLSDALREPAAADWARPTASLPLLFASVAEHPDRDDFIALCPQVAQPAALQAAQRILTRSGAISYCVLKLVELAQQVQRDLSAIPLPTPRPFELALEALRLPIISLLRKGGHLDAEAALRPC